MEEAHFERRNPPSKMNRSHTAAAEGATAKMNRNHTAAAEGATGTGGEYQETSAGASDDGPSHDDFQKLRKLRNSTNEGRSAAHPESYTLTEAVKGGKEELIRQVARSWLKRYQKDRTPAMAELLTFVFQACGARNQIENDMVSRQDIDEVVGGCLPIREKGEIEHWKLLLVWHILVIESKFGPLLDGYLFDKAIKFIISLSGFVAGHVATMMGLQLINELIGIANSLRSKIKGNEAMRNAAKKHGTVVTRLEEFNEANPTSRPDVLKLEELMSTVFERLFCHRHRDVEQKIQSKGIKYLGGWIKSYQSLFLENSKTKFLGWALNDESARVRNKSLRALESLYNVAVVPPGLIVFSGIYYNRIVRLVGLRLFPCRFLYCCRRAA